LFALEGVRCEGEVAKGEVGCAAIVGAAAAASCSASWKDAMGSANETLPGVDVGGFRLTKGEVTLGERFCRGERVSLVVSSATWLALNSSITSRSGCSP